MGSGVACFGASSVAGDCAEQQTRVFSELTSFVDKPSVGSLEFESGRGDANEIRGDCSVTGFAVESTTSDDSTDVWDGTACERGSPCSWIDVTGWALNSLESVFDPGEGGKTRSGSIDSLDPGIEQGSRGGSGERTMTESGISHVFCLFGRIPVGVGGGDEAAGDVASPRISLEK